jgi:hypothetical protein
MTGCVIVLAEGITLMSMYKNQKDMKNKLAALLLIAGVLFFPAIALADPCDNTANKNGVPVPSKVQNCVTSTPLIHDIQVIVNFLAAAVGIIVTGVILLGGIQYILAGGNATALTAARQRIINGLIALFAFLFMYAFLQWIIPGGIFNK